MSGSTTPKNVLFLNSAAGIWAHSATDAILVRRLSDLGARVSLLNCNGYLQGLCAVRQSRNRSLVDLKKTPNLDCNDCKFTSSLMGSSLTSSVSSHWLGAFLTEEDRAQAMDFIEGWIRDGIPIEREFRGVPVARLGGYEASLKFKSWENATKGEGRQEYLLAVADCALTVSAAQNFLASREMFEAVVIRSPHYGVNGSFGAVAKDLGMKVVFLDGSLNLAEDGTHVMVWDWNSYSSGNPALDFFNISRGVPIEQSLVRIHNHFKALNGGGSFKVYSEGRKGNGQALSLLGGSTVLPTMLLALSSTDEVVSAKQARVNPRILYPGSVFSDQFEWVEQTISWFAQRPQYQLIIRVHPREFPNKRDSVTSPAGIQWEEVLRDLPSNVIVNHPNQRISIYDIFDESEAVTTGWSSVGLEAAMQSLRLVTYDSSLPLYPAAIGLTGNSVEQYFANIELALTCEETLSHRDNALRWLDLVMIAGTSRIGGRLLASKRNFLPRWVNLILEGLDRYFFFIFRPLDLWRGILLEPTDGKFARVILEGRSNLYE